MNKKIDFNKYSIAIIDQKGNDYKLERNVLEINHCEAFSRLELKFPNLFVNYPDKIINSGGYEISSYIALDNNIVIWPFVLKSPLIMMVNLPECLTDEQCNMLKQYMSSLKDYKICAIVTSFQDGNINNNWLTDMKSYEEVKPVIENYIDNKGIINKKTNKR